MPHFLLVGRRISGTVLATCGRIGDIVLLFSTVVFTIAALLVGCSDQPETRDEVVEAVWGAVASGDDATWRSLHHEDATVAFPDGEMIELFGPSTWVQDDYDQDGVLSFADEMLLALAHRFT